MDQRIPISDEVRDQMWANHERRGRIVVASGAVLFIAVLVGNIVEWKLLSWGAAGLAVVIGVAMVIDLMVTEHRTRYDRPILPHPEIVRQVEEADRGIDEEESK